MRYNFETDVSLENNFSGILLIIKVKDLNEKWFTKCKTKNSLFLFKLISTCVSSLQPSIFVSPFDASSYVWWHFLSEKMFSFISFTCRVFLLYAFSYDRVSPRFCCKLCHILRIFKLIWCLFSLWFH